MKKFLTTFILLSIVTWFIPGYIFAGTGEAIEYLKIQSIDDWSAQSLIAAGETDFDIGFLNDFNPSNATDLEKRILTLAALGINPAEYYSGKDLINDLQSDYYLVGQIGDQALLNDDFFGILALASVNQTDNLVFSDSVSYVLANQNVDGGWSWGIGQTSDTNDTAAAVMALLEAGYSVGDTVIANAINYLIQAKNTDGGWPYSPGGESDSASTAWVIMALQKANEQVDQASFDFLNSLQTSDGSFKWVAGDETGSKGMTSYALIALSGKYFPVKKLSKDSVSGNYLRIEGSEEMYCEGYFNAATALEIVEIAAAECGYTYNIKDTSYGPYLNKINNDEASGVIGWMYFVNWGSPAVGAADYNLQLGDEIIWYFGEWGEKPLRLEISANSAPVNEPFNVLVAYYDETDQSWHSAEGAVVNNGNQDYVMDSNGRSSISIANAGTYILRAEKSGYVRSNPVTIKVGSSVSDSITWQVEIEDSSLITNPELSFEIEIENIDFGKLAKGQTSVGDIMITNNGTVPIYLEAIVSGEQSLINNFKLNGELWADFNKVITQSLSETIKARLTIPQDYEGDGNKNGDIIFWGTTAD